MSYLITGGIGYIGSHLINKLIDEEKKVIAFDKVPWSLSNKLGSTLRDVKLVQGDVTNITDLLDVVKRYNVEYIVHLAAIHIGEPGITIFDRSSATSPFEWINVDVMGILNVFEAARILDVRRVIYASSIAVLPTGPVEDAPKKPGNLYGWCKALDEFLGQLYYDTYGLDNIGLRFGYVYGPGKRAGDMWLVDIVRKPALGKPCVIEKHPEKMVHWQYVKDCIKVINLSLNVMETKNKIFNTFNQPSTLLEVAGVVKKFLPDAEIKFVPKGARARVSQDQFESIEFDISRAREELGYNQTSLEEGIKDFINETRKEAGLPTII